MEQMSKRAILFIIAFIIIENIFILLNFRIVYHDRIIFYKHSIRRIYVYLTFREKSTEFDYTIESTHKESK